MELAVSQREVDAIQTLQSQATQQVELAQTCWCFAPKDELPVASEADEGEAPFASALRAYNWPAAEALASSEEERQDVRDSKARVEWMRHCIKQHNYSKALEMAITNAEVERGRVEASVEGLTCQ